jgi:AraC-like DNA-binding protein
MAHVLTGQRVEGSMDFALPEPPWFARFAHLTRGPVRFGQPTNQFVYPAASLAFPLTMANAVAMRLAREQCERELDELGRGGGAAARIRALMNESGTRRGLPSIEQAARALGVSSRTLKRRLADDGTDFSTLLDEQRRNRALALLRSPDLSIAEIADRVGYSDVANFTRAFRRWTKTTPATYRSSHKRKKN